MLSNVVIAVCIYALILTTSSSTAFYASLAIFFTVSYGILDSVIFMENINHKNMLLPFTSKEDLLENKSKLMSLFGVATNTFTKAGFNIPHISLLQLQTTKEMSLRSTIVSHDITLELNNNTYKTRTGLIEFSPAG